jgi:hypothetical protein
MLNSHVNSQLREIKVVQESVETPIIARSERTFVTCFGFAQAFGSAPPSTGKHEICQCNVRYVIHYVGQHWGTEGLHLKLNLTIYYRLCSLFTTDQGPLWTESVFQLLAH